MWWSKHAGGSKKLQPVSPFIFPAQINHFLTLNLACRRKKDWDGRWRSARGSKKMDGRNDSVSSFACTHLRCSGLKPYLCCEVFQWQYLYLEEWIGRTGEQEARVGPSLSQSFNYEGTLSTHAEHIPSWVLWSRMGRAPLQRKALRQTFKWGEGEAAVLHGSADPTMVRQSPGWTFY